MKKKSNRTFTDEAIEEAKNIIAIHGANAIDYVQSCTPLERALLIELRRQGITRIERRK